MEYTTLKNGIRMPMEWFGVFQVPDKEECKAAVLTAIRAGDRLIYTAASYSNEDAVGEAVREAIAEGICTREELFITSKMWVQDMENYDTAKAAIDASLEKTGLEYLDLYLLHQAMKDYFSAWRAMEDAYRDGKLKAIGVSNFYPHCALPGFVDSKNEEKTERNAGYLVVSHSGGGMLRQGTRKGIRRTPANRGMRAHWVVKGLDISEDVCHGMCP